jgi:hypothetical protein
VCAVITHPKLKDEAKERKESTLKKGELAPVALKSTQRETRFCCVEIDTTSLFILDLAARRQRRQR